MYPFDLEAACACRAGRESVNQDNFFFDGRCLPADNSGLKHAVFMSKSLEREVCFAVFDGIGEYDFGQAASLAAAQGMRTVMQRLDSYCIPEKTFLQDACLALHGEVLREKARLRADRMGASMAALFFSQGYVYQCCLGDVRAYRLRGGEFLQLSRDHVQPDAAGKKGPPSRFLGMDAGEEPLKPYISKGELRSRDKYLICSDGVTSALTNLEIDDILLCSPDLGSCAQELADRAFLNGAQKNITAVVVEVIAKSPSP